MALRNIELYEALKGSVGEDAARLIAEVVPTAAELATKRDLELTRLGLEGQIGSVRLEVGDLRTEMREGFATLRGDLSTQLQKSSKETMRWMLTFFIPVWIGTWGTILAIVLKR